VRERHALVLVFLRDGHDEAEVRAHELLERLLVVLPDEAGEAGLLVPVDQRVLADLLQVLVQGGLPGGTPARGKRHGVPVLVETTAAPGRRGKETDRRAPAARTWHRIEPRRRTRNSLRSGAEVVRVREDGPADRSISGSALPGGPTGRCGPTRAHRPAPAGRSSRRATDARGSGPDRRSPSTSSPRCCPGCRRARSNGPPGRRSGPSCRGSARSAGACSR